MMTRSLGPQSVFGLLSDALIDDDDLQVAAIFGKKRDAED